GRMARCTGLRNGALSRFCRLSRFIRCFRRSFRRTGLRFGRCIGVIGRHWCWSALLVRHAPSYPRDLSPHPRVYHARSKPQRSIAVTFGPNYAQARVASGPPVRTVIEGESTRTIGTYDLCLKSVLRPLPFL